MIKICYLMKKIVLNYHHLCQKKVEENQNKDQFQILQITITID
jgi:hypothetical protein